MASSENTDAAAAAETAPQCTGTMLPNRLTRNGLEYAITDENRKEIEQDFHDHALGNRKFDFAEKWKAAYLGPSNRAQSRGDQQAKEKPRQS